MENQINKKATIILSIWVVLLFTWIGGVSYITDRIEQDYKDSIYYYKILNAPVRSLPNYNITQDSVCIEKLEKEYKRLVK